MMKKVKFNSYDTKKLKEFIKLAVKRNNLGKKKYSADHYMKDNIMEFLVPEIIDAVNYLFFLYLKFNDLHKEIISLKDIKETNKVKKLR